MTPVENIRARIGKEDGDKEAFTFEERYQELEEEIKHEVAAAKSNLKQSKGGTQRRRKLKQKKKRNRKQ